MKTTGSKKIRALSVIVLTLIIALMLITVTACSEEIAVESIEIVENSVSGYYSVSGFDISTVQLLVKYVDGSTNTINAEKSMLTTEGKNQLTTTGEKNVTLFYKGKSATLAIKLFENDESIVCVTFKDKNGANELGKIYTEVGGKVTAPTPPSIEGETFRYWTDSEGKEYDLSKVDNSVTLYASYSGNKTQYVVKFFDHKGEVLQTENVDANGKIAKGDVPSVNLKNYPELEGYSWSVSFPFTVEADTVINLVPVYKSFSVLFAYKMEGDATNSITFIEGLGKVVTYETDVTNLVKDAKKALENLDYVIKGEPSNSTKITKDTTFLFTVTQSLVNVKVYNDTEKASLKSETNIKIGEKHTLPNTASVQAGKIHVGWGIEGEDVFIKSGDSWTASVEYGNTIVFIPIYEEDTITVKFDFVFVDVKLENEQDKNVIASVTIEDYFYLNGTVNYNYVDSLLNKYKNENLEVTYNSDSTEKDEAELLLPIVGIENITVNIGGKEEYVDLTHTVSLKINQLTFAVKLTAKTTGLELELATGEDGNYYKVVGLNSDYVEGTNVHIPDEYNGNVVKEIATTELQGKTITHVSKNIQTICESAFEESYIYGDVNIEKATSVGANAFKDATLTGAITFKELTTLGESAFKGSKKQVEEGTEKVIKINLGEKLAIVPANAFENSKGISEIILPSTVVEIGDGAFKNSEVEKITSLENVATVGEEAFYATKVSELILPKLAIIGSSAFGEIENLETVAIGTTATTEGIELDMALFAGSINVNSIEFGLNVQSVIDSVGCLASLTKVATVTVTEGSSYLYADEGVVYAINGTEYSVKYYPAGKTGSYVANIPNATVINLDASAFNYALVSVLDLSNYDIGTVSNVTTGIVYAVIIKAEEDKESVENAIVSAEVFVGEQNTYGYENGLIYKKVTQEEVTTVTILAGDKYAEEIVVPEKIGGIAVTAIANSAFENFENLTSLEVNAKVNGWDASILNGCDKLERLYIEGFSGAVEKADFAGNAWYKSRNVIYVGEKNLGYNNDAYDANNKRITTISKEDVEEYFGTIIPKNYFFIDDGNGNNVCNLTSIDLSTVVTVEAGAFYGCASLKEVVLDGVNNLGKEAFAFCTALEEITFNGEGMGDGVFQNCTALKKVTLTGKINEVKGKRYLPIKTFAECANLEEVILSQVNAFANDSEGNSYAFSGCSNLTYYDFSTVLADSIPGYTFAETGLKFADFTLMPSVVNVGACAFYGADIIYVKLSKELMTIGHSAFNVGNLAVEIPYDYPSGVYSDEANVHDEAFDDSTAIFYIVSTVDTDHEFLADKDSEANYPTVEYALGESIDEEGQVLGMISDSNTIFFEEEFIATTLPGYTFVGWYAEKDEMTEISFPLVVTSDTTYYAKYYNDNKGSVSDTTDIKYAYFIATQPSIDIVQGETVVWYVTDGSNRTNVDAFPFIMDADGEKEYKVYAEITDGVETTTIEYAGVGSKGYALVNYADGNANNISIPDFYDDGVNGKDEIIVVYAGAFNNENLILKELTLPENTIALLLGKGQTQDAFENFDTTATFNKYLTSISIPDSVEYIADGVFKNLSNLEEIVFSSNSKLTYATVNTFYGSKWYLDQLKGANTNNGFIVAGGLALQFVGTGDTLIYNAEEQESGDMGQIVQEDFGFIESINGISVIVTVYYKNGTITQNTYETTATLQNENVYQYKITSDKVKITFTLNSIDNTNWNYSKDDNLFTIDESESTNKVYAVSIKAVQDEKVTIPNEVVKLNDGIFENNTEITTIVLNNNLVTVGNRAFKNSALNKVLYGAKDTEKDNSKVNFVGEEAFVGTDWYRNEQVILGKLFLKYNNVSGMSSLILTGNVTSIEKNAFYGVRLDSLDITTLKGLVNIGAFAFANSGIKNMTIPASVTTVGRGIFMGSASVNSVTIESKNLQVLPQDTFNGASNLATLTIDNVMYLGKNSLKNCINLATINASKIEELLIVNGDYESGLGATSWYNDSKIDEGANTKALILGKVFVKFLIDTTKIDDDKPIEVIVPDGITTIAQEAFASVGKVKKITLPSTVTYVGVRAFAEMAELVEIVFGGNEEIIDEYAFWNSMDLTTAVLPNSLIKIGNCAFMNTMLTTMEEDGTDNGYTIPESVTEIGNNAFRNSALTIINIGTVVSSEGGKINQNLSLLVKIGEGAFSQMKNLYKVNWALDVIEKEILDEEGNVIEIIERPVITINREISSYIDGIFTSDNTIRFYSNEDAVKYIGSSEFIGKDTWWTFNTYSAYPMVQFDNSGYNLSAINAELIREGDIPTPVHDTDREGNTYTFMYWIKSGVQERITYPYYVYEDVTFEAVWYKNEIVQDDRGVITGNDGAIFGVLASNKKATIKSITNSEKTLYIPNTIDGNKVSNISLDTKNDTVEEIILTNGSNFNGFASNIFRDFTALNKITVLTCDSVNPDYTVAPTELTVTIGDEEVSYTFYTIYNDDNTKLIAFIGSTVNATKEIIKEKEYEETDEVYDFIFKVPDTVTEIYSNALINSGIKTVYLPASIKTLGENALGESVNRLQIQKGIYLTDVEYGSISVNAPIMQASSEYVTYGEYIEIKGLKSAYVVNNSTYGNFYAIGNAVVAYTTSVMEYNQAFNIPNEINGFNITVISSNINKAEKEISINGSLGLPTALIKINANAFENIDFASISYTGNDLQDVANDAFGATSYYENANSDVLILGKVLIKYQNAIGEITVPNGITNIAYNAFNGSQATKINLPESLTSISANAFYGSSKLVEINIPDNVTYIGNSAFHSCASLTTVVFDTIDSKLKEIGSNVFFGNKKLGMIELPHSLEKIGDNAFLNCSSLASITFDGLIIRQEEDKEIKEVDPEKTSKLTELGASAFANCGSLTSIKIPNGVQEIKASTFQSCESLTDVEFDVVNSNLVTIGEQAFENCKKLGSNLDISTETISLVTVNLPNKLVEVGTKAFSGCEGMWGIQFNYNIDSIGSAAFSGCKNLAKVEIYRATAPNIESDTFITGDDAYYRLRIYVNMSENGTVLNKYATLWDNKWNTDNDKASDHLYERGDLPKVIFLYNEGTEAETRYADVILNPTAQIEIDEKIINMSNFTYVSLSQLEERGGASTTRESKNLNEYGNQKQDKNTILIVDYDEVKLLYKEVSIV